MLTRGACCFAGHFFHPLVVIPRWPVSDLKPGEGFAKGISQCQRPSPTWLARNNELPSAEDAVPLERLWGIGKPPSCCPAFDCWTCMWTATQTGTLSPRVWLPAPMGHRMQITLPQAEQNAARALQVCACGLRGDSAAGDVVHDCGPASSAPGPASRRIYLREAPPPTMPLRLPQSCGAPKDNIAEHRGPHDSVPVWGASCPFGGFAAATRPVVKME